MSFNPAANLFVILSKDEIDLCVNALEFYRDIDRTGISEQEALNAKTTQSWLQKMTIFSTDKYELIPKEPQ